MRAAVALGTCLMAGCTFTRRLEPLPVPATVAEPLEASVVLVIDRPWTFFGDPAPRLAHIDRARIEAALRASGCVTFSTVRLEIHPAPLMYGILEMELHPPLPTFHIPILIPEPTW